MNVKVIRMNTGEEVIVTLLNETEDSIEIENPLVGMPTQTGQIGFGPWAPLVKNDDSITLSKSYIVYLADAQVDVVEQYEKIFSPIETPSKKLIL
tara:strand:- start:8424 stop:8708 length:285 start_codon:yes stop_codon:yes gene_type:complete